MKTNCGNHNPHRSFRRLAGMTLVEVMIASGIMLLVIAAVLSANLIGFKENQLMASKSGANNTSRYVVTTLLQDIRAAKGYQIGSYTGTNSFTSITNGLQQGIALELFPFVVSTNETVNTNQFIIYYYDSSDSANSDGRLWRYSSVDQTMSVMASNLLNPLLFYSEDYSGTVQSARTYKGVIHTTLQFCEFQYPTTKVGAGSVFNSYRVDCRATPHLPDGP